jgi:predicted TIM-barrel fold metal-dependent hydrolase
MMIAVEEHWSTPELAAALKRLPAGRRDDSLAFNEMGDNLSRLEDIGAARLAEMDAQGVDMAVLSLAPPGTQPLDPADAVALSRAVNDIAAAAVGRYPARLKAFAALPMADPQAAAAEFERAVRDGFAGAMVYGRTGDVPLDDPRYDDLFAVAAASGRPISIHPQIPTAAVREAMYGGFDETTGLVLATAGWGWHAEAAVAALRLIVRGTFDRHPNLQIILGHWGELLPFWSDRTKSLSRVAKLDRTPGDYLRSNFHLTSSGMFSPALLHHALEVTTSDRLLFSVDYPFHRPARDEVESFLAEFPDDEDRAKFAAGNARELLGIRESPLPTADAAR